MNESKNEAIICKKKFDHANTVFDLNFPTQTKNNISIENSNQTSTLLGIFLIKNQILKIFISKI